MLLAALAASSVSAVPRPQEAQPATDKAAAAEGAREDTPKRKRRLRLDVDSQVDKMLEEKDRLGIPRFHETVEVVAKSPQFMLERFFGGLDLECGPVPGGAPTHVESRAFRPHPGLAIDLVAITRILVDMFQKKLRKDPSDRYFLYRVRRADDVTFSLRDGRVPDSTYYNTPGTTYELVASFEDLKSATRAWQRLERGFATAVSTVSATPAAVWQTAPCRPVKR